MQSLRRLGGSAGILAGLAAAWFFAGLVVIYPSAGLNPIDQFNPDKALPFVAANQGIFWLVNILGALLAPLLAVGLLLGLTDRLRDIAPARSRLALWLGTIGVTGLAAAAMVTQFGLGSLGALYTTDRVAATHAFYAVSGIADGLSNLGEVSAGAAAVLYGWAMLEARRYRAVGYLSFLTGVALVLAGLVFHAALIVTAFVLTIIWLIWAGAVLRIEAKMG